MDFASKYRSQYNEALLSYGYNDISGLLSSLTDVLVLKQSSTGTFYVYPKSSTSRSTSVQATISKAKPKIVTDEFKESLRRCISEFTDGVSVSDFLLKYKVKWTFFVYVLFFALSFVNSRAVSTIILTFLNMAVNP